MYCKFCGASIEDDVLFCGNCGKKQTEEIMENVAGKLKEGRVKSKYKKLIGFVILLGLLLLIPLLFVFRKRSPEKTAEQYLKAAVEGDFKKIVKLMPREFLESILEAEDITEKEYIEYLEEVYERAIKTCKDYKYSFKICDIEDISAEETQLFKDYFKRNGVHKEVKHVKNVIIEQTYRKKGISNNEEFTEEGVLTVVNIGRNWYIVSPACFYKGLDYTLYL